MSAFPSWAGIDSPIARLVDDFSRRCLAAYEVNPTLIREHAAIERATRQGGYGRRQLYELVQNGADALLDSPGGRIEVILTPKALYCANEGAPVDAEGVEAILSSNLNVKKGNEIGRFGIGFKSVLAVSDTPEFFSRSGSFRFDARRPPNGSGASGPRRGKSLFCARRSRWTRWKKLRSSPVSAS